VAFRHIGGQWGLSFPSISLLSSLLPRFVSTFRAPIGAMVHKAAAWLMRRTTTSTRHATLTKPPWGSNSSREWGRRARFIISGMM
jgi:chorismate-pyruvate lyase